MDLLGIRPQSRPRSHSDPADRSSKLNSKRSLCLAHFLFLGRPFIHRDVGIIFSSHQVNPCLLLTRTRYPVRRVVGILDPTIPLPSPGGSLIFKARMQSLTIELSIHGARAVWDSFEVFTGVNLNVRTALGSTDISKLRKLCLARLWSWDRMASRLSNQSEPSGWAELARPIDLPPSFTGALTYKSPGYLMRLTSRETLVRHTRRGGGCFMRSRS